jgi:negative regulator of replication initiation
MRTTLAIDDDVLIAAKAIARQQNRSVGEVVSDLARRALHRPRSGTTRNGIPLLPRDAGQAVVTLETVNALRDELP